VAWIEQPVFQDGACITVPHTLQVREVRLE
jgi:hypothetical protein